MCATLMPPSSVGRAANAASRLVPSIVEAAQLNVLTTDVVSTSSGRCPIDVRTSTAEPRGLVDRVDERRATPQSRRHDAAHALSSTQLSGVLESVVGKSMTGQRRC